MDINTGFGPRRGQCPLTPGLTDPVLVDPEGVGFHHQKVGSSKTGVPCEPLQTHVKTNSVDYLPMITVDHPVPVPVGCYVSCRDRVLCLRESGFIIVTVSVLSDQILLDKEFTSVNT